LIVVILIYNVKFYTGNQFNPVQIGNIIVVATPQSKHAATE